jgi:hypothetical protein
LHTTEVAVSEDSDFPPLVPALNVQAPPSVD